MTSSGVVDTNYLVRLFTKTPASQAHQVLSLLEQSEPNSIDLSGYVISELVYVLLYHNELAFSRAEVAQGLEIILAHPAWRVDDVLHQEAIDIFAKTQLDYVDCLVAAEYVLKRSVKVLTFDKKLQKYLQLLT